MESSLAVEVADDDNFYQDGHQERQVGAVVVEEVEVVRTTLNELSLSTVTLMRKSRVSNGL